MQIIRDTDTMYHPIFLKILEDIPGGVTIKNSELPTSTEVLKSGTVLGVATVVANRDDLYHVVKTFTIHATSAAKAVSVKKNHLLKEGDFIANGTRSSEITAINTANTTHDVLTVVANMAWSANDVGYQSTSEGTTATNRAFLNTAIGVSKDNLDVKDAALNNLNIQSSVVVRGSLKESLVEYPVTSAIKTTLSDRIRWV